MFTPEAERAVVEVLTAGRAAPTVIAFEGFRHELKVFNVNVLLVKDPINSGYQRGVYGLGDSIDAVADRLVDLVPRGSQIVGTVGPSIGGMAAIMYGHHLGVARVLALAPRTVIRQGEARGRLMELPAGLGIDIDELERYMLEQPTADLLTYLGDAPRAPIEVHVGASSDWDVEHALRIQDLPNVTVIKHPTAEHNVAGWLQAEGRLGEVLATSLGLARR
jgi:hypothetical protein